MKQRVIYYSDELSDDFANTNIKRKKLPDNYKYFTKNPLRRLIAFLIYYVIAFPIVFLLNKIVYREKIVGRRKLRKYRRTGYFLYGNHTRVAGDAFTPALTVFPKKAYIICDPDAVSIPGIRMLVEDLGAVPLPTGLNGMKNYVTAVKFHAYKNHAVIIYPEAHIWPYYTKIREFGDSSFRYPAETFKPTFTFTTVFKKRKFIKRPKTVVYVDGPFFGEVGKSAKENKRALRDACIDAMKKRAALSDIEYIKYIKKEKDSPSPR